MGEQALRALFGFTVAGYPDPADINVEAVHLYVCRVTDPSGAEQAAREAMYADVLPRMRSLGTFEWGSAGAMHEIGADDR